MLSLLQNKEEIVSEILNTERDVLDFIDLISRLFTERGDAM
jgi:hypothetical protein